MHINHVDLVKGKRPRLVANSFPLHGIFFVNHKENTVQSKILLDVYIFNYIYMYIPCIHPLELYRTI